MWQVFAESAFERIWEETCKLFPSQFLAINTSGKWTRLFQREVTSTQPQTPTKNCLILSLSLSRPQDNQQACRSEKSPSHNHRLERGKLKIPNKKVDVQAVHLCRAYDHQLYDTFRTLLAEFDVTPSLPSLGLLYTNPNKVRKTNYCNGHELRRLRRDRGVPKPYYLTESIASLTSQARTTRNTAHVIPCHIAPRASFGTTLTSTCELHTIFVPNLLLRHRGSLGWRWWRLWQLATIDTEVWQYSEVG